MKHFCAAAVLLSALWFAASGSVAAAPVTMMVTIIAAPDGASLRVEDGMLIRLAGIDSPAAEKFCRRDAKGRDCAFLQTQGEAAQKMLHARAAGRQVRLTFDAARRQDRHGRLTALAALPASHDGAPDDTLQEYLLGEGLAYIRNFTEIPSDVAARFLARERLARRTLRGMWQSGALLPVAAARAGRRIGDYVFVVGTVQKTAQFRDRIYLNFGADWRKDFTAVVEKKDWKNFRGFDLAGLRGRRATVRGVLYQDNGPMLRLHHPGQIEIAPAGE